MKQAMMLASLVLFVGLAAGCGPSYLGPDQAQASEKGPLVMAAQTGGVYDFTLDDIDGKPTPTGSLPADSRGSTSRSARAAFTAASAWLEPQKTGR